MATGDAKIFAKGLNLLEELARSDGGIGVVELAEKVDLHKRTIYRYLNSLLDAGYVESNGDGLYYLGSKILELGSQKLKQMPLRETAHPFLIGLNTETEMTVHLCVLDGRKVFSVARLV